MADLLSLITNPNPAQAINAGVLAVVNPLERALGPFAGLAKGLLSNLFTPPLENQNFNINYFIQNISKHNETARADKFICMIPIPLGLQLFSGESQDLQLQCETSEIPGKDIAMVEYRVHQFIQRVPHMIQYPAANFTFIVTGDMHEKQMFDGWMDYMLPTQSGLITYPQSPSGMRNYETDITCIQFDAIGNPAYAVQLLDAMPISIAPLNQNWNDDSIHRLNVTFAYRKWTSIATQDYTISSFSAAGSNPVSASQNSQTPSTVTNTGTNQSNNPGLPSDLGG